jgi:ADP-heptose:LPS heptosyltransferase
MVEEKSSDILSEQPELDTVIVFPRTAWARGLMRGRWNSLGSEALRFVRRLREERFDLAIDFHGILKSGVLSAMSGAEIRVGFDRRFCKEWNHLFNNWRVSLTEKRISRFERNTRLLQGLGLDTDNCDLRLHVSTEDHRYASRFLEEQGLVNRCPLIAIHPGTSEKTRYKRWFPERYAQLADGLVEQVGASIMLTWGPGEHKTAEQVQSYMKSPSVVSCPTRSLKQLAGLYQHCQLYIGGDTGPMHIASLMGVPVVGIYGPTDPIINAPYRGSPSIQVRKDLPCSPCRDLKCQRLDCLKAISPEDVLRAALDLLSQAKQASTRVTPASSESRSSA